MQFVVFHGSFGNPNGNWSPYIKKHLEIIGQKVIAPQFPIENYDKFTENGPNQKPQNQNLSNWLDFFEKYILPQLDTKEKISFIGHSIGPVFILHAVEKFRILLDSAFFVAPFMESSENIPWQYKSVNSSFYKKDFNYKKIKKLIPLSFVFYSENDPYVPNKLSIEFAEKLGSKQYMMKGLGHFNNETGVTKFPFLFELCQVRIKSTFM
jgi:uncharacterized protein